jgi:hypothetical protein
VLEKSAGRTTTDTRSVESLAIFEPTSNYRHFNGRRIDIRFSAACQTL